MILTQTSTHNKSMIIALPTTPQILRFCLYMEECRCDLFGHKSRFANCTIAAGDFRMLSLLLELS